MMDTSSLAISLSPTGKTAVQNNTKPRREESIGKALGVALNNFVLKLRKGTKGGPVGCESTSTNKLNMLHYPPTKSLARRIAAAAKRADREADELGTFTILGENGPQPLEEFGMLLSIVRRKRGLNIETLAQKANMDPDKLVDIELGFASIDETVEFLDALSFALDTDPELLAQLLVQSLFND